MKSSLYFVSRLQSYYNVLLEDSVTEYQLKHLEGIQDRNQSMQNIIILINGKYLIFDTSLVKYY